jgi:AmmeMemoRadiSam system protein B
MPPEPAVDPAGSWETPLGDLPINEALVEELLAADIGLTPDSAAHREEHSIEVSLPFIRFFFPTADFVPIACPFADDLAAFGSSLGAFVRDRSVAVVASTDLTHYGAGYGIAPKGDRAEDALAFLRENDARMLDLVRGLNAEAIVPEARAHGNACGSGALAAACAATKAMGAREGVLVEYRTSYDVMPEDTIQRVVGYGGMVMV